MTAVNAPTRIVLSTLASPRGMRELFLRAYATYAPWCRQVEEPGLAVLAVDAFTALAAGCVRVRAGIEHRAAIVGRHERCDLSLRAHRSLALRQLAIILDPVRSWRPGAGIRYRALDLRTASGFTDEAERPIRGLSAEGPAMLWCGGYALFLLPVGDPTDWPAKPSDGWAILPERVYFDDAAPRNASMPLIGDDNDVADGIELATSVDTLAIGASALRDGVLLGRYERCDGAGLLKDPSISRVHLLLLHVDDMLLAIDTASTHGTRRAGSSNARTLVLEGYGAELIIGKQTSVRWRWFS